MVTSNKIYCVGYPKSGNTWINYICLTLKKVEFENVHIINDWGIYLKTHAVKDGETFDTNNLLITPVRDYKECIISYRAGHDIEKLKKHIAPFEPGTMNYIRPLKIYDEWPDERRLMVYYEDLISDPETQIGRIANHINCEDQLQDFISNIQHHKYRCMSHYNMDCQESKSHGNYIDFHKKVLPIKQQKEWDRVIKNSHPELSEKYLRRYLSA